MGSSPGGDSQRVVLHVGVPKSGTTFLQRALWSNRKALRELGISLPGTRQREMFLAAVEVREGYRFWGYAPEEIDGTWAVMCKHARDHPGTTIMSHELLGGATEEQARRALAGLEGLDVHVVLTVRDLVRQATSEWQEQIKNGNKRRFARFQRRILRQIARGSFDSGFWRNQDPVRVLERWAAHLPPSRVHVVVAPPSGADPGVLWQRFGSAAGFDAAQLSHATPDAPANQALGTAQVSVLRRVNKALDGRIPQPEYARVVKYQFAEGLLAAQSSERPQCPQRLALRLREIAEQRNATITAAGYQVHGDLAELVPEVPPDAVSPDKIGDAVVLEAFADAVASMLVERAETQRQGLLRRAPEAAPPSSLGRRIARRLGR